MDGSTMQRDWEYFIRDFSVAISSTLQFLAELGEENISVTCEAKRRDIQELLINVKEQTNQFRQPTRQNSDINQNTTVLGPNRLSLETLHLKGLCEPHKSKKHRHHGLGHHSKRNGDSVPHVTSESHPRSKGSETESPAKEIPNQNGDLAKVIEEAMPEHDHVWSRSSMSTKRRFFDKESASDEEANGSKNDENVMMAEEEEDKSAEGPDNEMPEPDVTMERTNVTSIDSQTALPILKIERVRNPSSLSEDEERGNNESVIEIPEPRGRNIRRDSVTERVKRKLRKYLKMEMRGSFDVSMVDLLDPDFSGWLIDQADDSKKWCVINDMLFCVFENDQSNLASDVFVLPACAVREMFFRSSAGNGSTRKYQIVVSSTCNEKEKVFAADSIVDHNEWLQALRHAVDHSTDIYSSDESASDVDADSVNGSMGSGYYPTPVKDMKESPGYNPTAKGSVTRDDKLHQHDTGGGTALFRKTDYLAGDSPQSSTGSYKAPSTSDESGDEEGLAPLPTSKPPQLSPMPQRRVSYLMATNREQQKSQANKQTKHSHSKSLMEKITPKRSKGFAGLKLPRSPVPMRKHNGGKKGVKKVKVTLESLKKVTLATYLRFKDHNKVTKCWCVIHEGKMYSFKTKGPAERCEICVDLSVSHVAITDKVGFEFKVTSDGNDHVFAAQDRYDFSRWIQELLPGNDVQVPNVALSSALRSTTESFCFDDGVRRSLEDLVDLRSEQDSALSIDESALRKNRHGTPSPLKRFDNDTYRRSTGHMLTDAKPPTVAKVPHHRKSKDDTYSAEIIKAIHSNPLDAESPTKEVPDPAKALDDPDCGDEKAKEHDSPLQGQTREQNFATLQIDAKTDSSSEEIIIPSDQSTLAPAVAPVLHSSPLTLKVNLDLDLSAPGTESPVLSEGLAYSAASECSSEDDLNIYNENRRVEAELSERWQRQRRSGSLETPLRRNLQPAALKRHFSDNSIKRDSLASTASEEGHNQERTRKRSSSVNIPTDYHNQCLEPKYGVLRSASNDSFHQGRPSIIPRIALEGQVEAVDENGICQSFWAVYNDLTLGLYANHTAIDPETLITLSRYSIVMDEGGLDRRPGIKLSQKDSGSILLFAGSEETTRRWHDVMKDDLTKLSIEGLNLEDANSRDFKIDIDHHLEEEEKKRKFIEELAKIRKEQLLNELLQQKHDLELKQARRKSSKKVATPECADLDHDHVTGEASDVMDGHTELQMVRDITYLKQRRISTQIKVDTIQKQLHESQKKPEKRLFKFTMNKKDHSTDNAHNKPKMDQLESHLKELTGKLETISESLTKQQSQQEKLKIRNEKKRMHNSFSSSDMSKNLSLSATLESRKSSASTEDLSQSSSQLAAVYSRARSQTSPDGADVVARKVSEGVKDKHKRLSEQPRPKPKLEIDPNALAEIEEFEKMSKMFLRSHSEGFRI
ncbi:uncharacterized protein LOC135497286 isoform X2 [Lineus longissimus]|uniref:uncharacterized protein LOC135497286 isoform X2 n=1 Tax=Lineus longissimus TaxID=88925 RepID=UPI002B4DC96E